MAVDIDMTPTIATYKGVHDGFVSMIATSIDALVMRTNVMGFEQSDTILSRIAIPVSII